MTSNSEGFVFFDRFLGRKEEVAQKTRSWNLRADLYMHVGKTQTHATHLAPEVTTVPWVVEAHGLGSYRWFLECALATQLGAGRVDRYGELLYVCWKYNMAWWKYATNWWCHNKWLVLMWFTSLQRLISGIWMLVTYYSTWSWWARNGRTFLPLEF